MGNNSSQKLSWVKQYPFLLLLSAIITGITIQHYLEAVSGQLWFFLFLFFSIGFAVIHFVSSVRSVIKNLRLITAILSFIFLGALLGFHQDIKKDKTWYGHQLNDCQALQVRITADPEQKEKTIYLPAEVLKVNKHNNWISVKGAIKLYVYLKDPMPSYHQGQILIMPNRLVPIRNSGNPFGADFAGFAARKGLYHQAFLGTGDILILDAGKTTPGIIQHTKTALLRSIAVNVKDSVTKALIEATLLNERAALNDELWRAYSVTGIVHIVAISGMHIAMLCSVLLFLLGWIRNKKWDWIKYFVAVALVWFYIALTDFPPSAVRAAVMFTLLAIGIKLNRTSNNINTWAAAAFLLLCYNPYWLYDVGIQLSFLAVLSILIFYLPVKKWFTPAGIIIRYLWEGIAVSIAAQILVFPLVLYYFHQFPLLSILANIPAALYSFLLMAGSLLLFFIDNIGLPAEWLGQVLTWLTRLFHIIVVALAEATPALMQQLYINAVEFVLMMTAIILFALFFFKQGGQYLHVALICCSLLVLSFIVQDLDAAKQQSMVVYNTSKTSAIDIFEGKHVIPVHSRQDTAGRDEKVLQYNQLPARLAYRAMHTDPASFEHDLYIINNHKILVLTEPINFRIPDRFPIDYVVVGSRTDFQPELWKQIFDPELIIIDGSVPRWKAKKWKSKAAHAAVKVHWVGEDGAWVYETARIFASGR